MWASIEFTYFKGAKLQSGQSHPRGVLHGELTSYAIGPYRLGAVSLKPGPQGGADLAIIFCPRFAGIGTEVFRISGLERLGVPPVWVHQEWICKPGPRPADMPGEPTRNRRP